MMIIAQRIDGRIGDDEPGLGGVRLIRNVVVFVVRRSNVCLIMVVNGSGETGDWRECFGLKKKFNRTQ